MLVHWLAAFLTVPCSGDKVKKQANHFFSLFYGQLCSQNEY